MPHSGTESAHATPRAVPCVPWRTEKAIESLHARHMPTQSWGDSPQDYSGRRNAVPAPARTEAAGWGVQVCPLLSRKGIAMNIHISHIILAPLVSLIAGVLILVVPRLLNYIVALYLIIIGLIGLFGTGNLLR